MKKKHAPSRMSQQSMCGYEATDLEYEEMCRRSKRHVNCERCLKRMA